MLSIKINGLDGIQKGLKDAQRATAALDGPLGELSFDPGDPASVQAALDEVDRLVNEKAGEFPKGSIAHGIVESAKESFRNTILERASAQQE